MLLFLKPVRAINPFTFIELLYSCGIFVAGKLEEALELYKRSQQFGVERAALHIRNVRVPFLTCVTHIYGCFL